MQTSGADHSLPGDPRRGRRHDPVIIGEFGSRARSRPHAGGHRRRDQSASHHFLGPDDGAGSADPRRSRMATRSYRHRLTPTAAGPTYRRNLPSGSTTAPRLDRARFPPRQIRHYDGAPQGFGGWRQPVQQPANLCNPAAGNGVEAFTSNILALGDTLNLTTALAATNWNGSTSTLPNYLKLTHSAQAATLSISATSGGSARGDRDYRWCDHRDPEQPASQLDYLIGHLRGSAAS